MRNHHKLVPTTCSSSKNSTKQEQHPHLSGAYIRSLVKQLSSSSTTRSNKDHHPSTMVTNKPHGQPQQQEQQATVLPPPSQQQPHKKQVRRRLHTSRPYQERLLNMAEARREIVTALKIHRASMRQAKEQQQQQQQLLQLQHQQEIQVVQAEQSQAARACIAPMSYGGSSFSADYLYSSPFAHFTAAAASTSSYSSPLAYHSTVPAAVAPMADALDHHLLPLPTQPLGLNLSFHGFGADVDDAKQHSAGSFDPPPLLQPSPASSYSVYSSPSVTTMASHHDYYMSSAAAVTAVDNTTTTPTASLGGAAADVASLHRVLDDEEMAAIYSIGEQHDIEWSDTVNLVTSAWWSKLLESVEVSGGGGATAAVQLEAQQAAVGAVEHTPDYWFGDQLGTSGSCSSDVLETTHLSERYHHGGYGDEDDVSALPRMDIGEIEGWDAGWFS